MRSIATVTPARDDAYDLARAVAAILAQRDLDRHEASLDAVVIAVGPSKDHTRAVADELAAADGRVVVVDNPEGTTPAALNAAIAATTAEFVVRVDARAVLPPSYIADAIETLGVTGAGNVGAIQHPVGTTDVERGIAAAMRSGAGTGGAHYRGTSTRRRVDTAWLGCFRREALAEVGGYDPAFIRNQDAELNHRLNAAGHEVWVDPRLVVEYRPRGSLRALASQYWQYGWWRRRTVRKHPDSLKLRQLASPIVVLALVVSVVGAALVSPWALIIAIAYLAAVLTAGLLSDGPFHQRLLTAAALVTMHLSWGAGFLASSLSRWSPPEAQRGST